MTDDAPATVAIPHPYTAEDIDRGFTASGMPAKAWRESNGPPHDRATAKAQIALFGCLQDDEMDAIWGGQLAALVAEVDREQADAAAKHRARQSRLSVSKEDAMTDDAVRIPHPYTAEDIDRGYTVTRGDQGREQRRAVPIDVLRLVEARRLNAILARLVGRWEGC